MSRTSLLVALSLVAGATAGTPAAQAKACAKPVKVAYSKGWSSVPWPDFGDGVDVTLATPVLAVDPTAPGTMYASDGVTLLVTTNGGCSWSTRFTAGDPATVGLFVSRIVVARVPHKRSLVYLELDTPSVTFRTSTALLRSDDGGKTFARADVGLPWAGSRAATTLVPGDPQETELSVAPSDGRVLYVRTQTTGLWASDDAGATWTPKHPVLLTDWYDTVPADVQHDKAFQCCTVDPLAPHDLWATTAYGVVHSTDGGATFRQVVNPGSHIVTRARLVASRASTARPALVAFQRADDYTVWGTRDGGKKWSAQFGGYPVRWQVRDPLALTSTGLLAFAYQGSSVKLVRMRASHGYVEDADVSGGWFNRFVAETAAVTGNRVTVCVVEWGYTTSHPIIERRTFTLT